MVSKEFFVIFVSFFLDGLARDVYNTQVFGIDPGDARTIEIIDSDYLVYNVGRTDLHLVFLYSNNAHRLDRVAVEVNVEPGEQSEVEIGHMFKRMGVSITNLSNTTRGLIHVQGTSKGYPPIDHHARNDYMNIDDHLLIKTLVSHSASFIPVIGDTLSVAISFFWPAPNQPSAWDEVEDEVAAYVDKKAEKIVKGILGGDIRAIRNKVEFCAAYVDNPKTDGKLGKYFMNVADSLLGLENKFIFDSKDDPDADNANYYLLPMYTNLINLKLLFYQYGIMNYEKVGLESDEVNRLLAYIPHVIGDDRRGAIKHVKSVSRKKFLKEYAEAYPETMYDQLATVRTYCAINGLQHIPNWEEIARNPKSTKKPNNPVLAFSTSFARTTALLTEYITKDDVPPPLQPKLVNGKLTRPVWIKVLLNTENVYAPLIAGMNISYANGDVLDTGMNSFNGDFEKVDFEGSKLLNLTARGNGKISYLEFGFEDGRIEKFGTPQGEKRTFALGGHHIVGFLMGGSRNLPYEDMAANLVVSYQLITDD